MPDDPGAGTPGGGGDTSPSPVAAGSPNPGAGAPSSGVLPPTGGAIPQPVKQVGKEATAIDVVRACAQALKSQALPFIQDRDFSHAIMEAVLKMEKFVPAPGMHDDHAGATSRVFEAMQRNRAAAGAPMGGGGALPGGRPPGMPQLPPGGGGAPPGMTGPPPG